MLSLRFSLIGTVGNWNSDESLKEDEWEAGRV